MTSRSKIDATGEGEEIGVPKGSAGETYPVRALRAWLAAAELSDGLVWP
jgi:hypothetical protein